MGKLLDAKLIADIAKVGAEIYGILADKSRDKEARERRIKELEEA